GEQEGARDAKRTGSVAVAALHAARFRVGGALGWRGRRGRFGLRAATAAVFGIGGTATAAGAAGTGRRAVVTGAGSVGGGSGRRKADARREIAQQGQGNDAAAQGGHQK